ncbi:hypothetical protein Rsub_09278 [Raphidocelis subcapitata]|uniref:Uncharacterized protein n=1 Tax=Raphidocelis subcapitata TaxID=307507 RepID=A0A2V0PHU7_9CHLO|nr:hypothetical protein Rsub_09278 [Raphidocelis subcapitata]|eukprot:GBF96645.1 hypothetical protein Rsub_09278 [Raphidocelis subcapitata]
MEPASTAAHHQGGAADSSRLFTMQSMPLLGADEQLLSTRLLPAGGPDPECELAALELQQRLRACTAAGPRGGVEREEQRDKQLLESRQQQERRHHRKQHQRLDRTADGGLSSGPAAESPRRWQPRKLAEASTSGDGSSGGRIKAVWTGAGEEDDEAAIDAADAVGTSLSLLWQELEIVKNALEQECGEGAELSAGDGGQDPAVEQPEAYGEPAAEPLHVDDAGPAAGMGAAGGGDGMLASAAAYALYRAALHDESTLPLDAPPAGLLPGCSPHEGLQQEAWETPQQQQQQQQQQQPVALQQQGAGPLLDMGRTVRAVVELQEARERAARLEAQCARMEAAVQWGELERRYLEAERALATAQCRRLTVMLACQACSGGPAGGDAGGEAAAAAPATAAGSAEAARREVEAAKARATDAWAALPPSSALRALGGPQDRLREVRNLGREVVRLLEAHRRDSEQLGTRASQAARAHAAAEARCARLASRLRSVAKAASVHAGEAEAGVRAAEAERDAAREREARLQRRLELLVLDHQAAEQALRERLSESEAQAAELRDLAAAQAAGVEGARAQLVESEARVGALETELALERADAGADVQEATALRSERRALVAALEDAEARLGAAAEQIAAADRERLGLMEAADQAAAVRDAAEARAQEQRAAAEAARLQAAEAAEALAEAQAEATDARRRLIAADGELRSARSALSDASDAAAARGAAADGLGMEVARLRDELASARAEAARLTERAHAAAAAEAAASEARSEAAAARAAAARAAAAAAASDRAARALEARVAQLAADAAVAKRQASSARAEVERARGQLLGIRAEVSAWAAEGSGDEDGTSSDESACGRGTTGPEAVGRGGGGGNQRARDAAALQEQVQLLQSLLTDARAQLGEAAAERARECDEAQRREDALALEASRLRGELAVASARLDLARRRGERRVQLLAEVAAGAEAEAGRAERGAAAVREASGLQVRGLQLEVERLMQQLEEAAAVCDQDGARQRLRDARQTADDARAALCAVPAAVAGCAAGANDGCAPQAGADSGAQQQPQQQQQRQPDCDRPVGAAVAPGGGGGGRSARPSSAGLAIQGSEPAARNWRP